MLCTPAVFTSQEGGGEACHRHGEKIVHTLYRIVLNDLLLVPKNLEHQNEGRRRKMHDVHERPVF